ncbi:hypothetical protein BJX99DRAFT_272742 [Aspergillus californicus]
MDKPGEVSHVEQPTKEPVRDALDAETQMGFHEALRLYPRAVLWSVGLSTAVIMEGYAVMLLSSFYALPQFNRKYGQPQPDGSYVISAPWKSGLSNGALCGEILGLLITGICQDRFGYRVTILGALCLVTGFIFVLFFAQNVEMLLVGEILCGLPWGAFQTITTAYASEVCPVALRAYLTTYVNLCWVLGQFIVSGVLKGVLDRQDEWAYRIPFAVQWVWPLPLMVMCILSPESPWWCVRQGRLEEARCSLVRLMSRSNNNNNNNNTVRVDTDLAEIQHTNELEKNIFAGTLYWQCFQGSNLRRTEIVCVTWLIQIICGSQLMGYSTVFYIAAGMDESASFSMSLIQYALGAVGTVLSCTNWAIGALLSVFTFAYDLTVGPVCYSLVSELSSTRLRAKSVVLARNLYNVGGIVVNILINYQLTSTAWNWGARSAFFWAGICFCCVVWIFFRLPEPRGRTYAELDVLFAENVPARKFSSTRVNVFESVRV